MKEAEFEKKFKVEVSRNEQGQVVALKHQEKIVDPLLSDKQKKDFFEREERKKAARRVSCLA